MLECRADLGDEAEASRIYTDLFWNKKYTPNQPPAENTNYFDRFTVIKEIYGEETGRFLLGKSVLSYDVQPAENDRAKLVKAAIVEFNAVVLLDNEFKPAWTALVKLARHNTPENNFELFNLCMKAGSDVFLEDIAGQLLSTAANQGYLLAIDLQNKLHSQLNECNSYEYSSGEQS